MEERVKQMAEQLAAPFPASEIEWRVGTVTKDKTKGMALAYLTARAVQDRLDEVFGPDGWSSDFQLTDKGFLCTLTCRFGDKWVRKTDGADSTQIEATKGGISGALKRAAVQLGIGRYLYYLPNVWHPLKNGRYLQGEPSLPAWALPGGRGRPPQSAAPPTTRMSSDEPAPQEPPKAAAQQPVKDEGAMGPPLGQGPGEEDGPPAPTERPEEPHWDGRPFLDEPFKLMPKQFDPEKYTWRHMLAGGSDGGRRQKLRWLGKRKADEGSPAATFIEMALDYAAACEAAGQPITEDECVPF